MPLVLLVTSSDWPDGEPGAPALDAALAARGLDARWVCWDDATVDWAAADLVAVRSTWDYIERHEEFVAWARRIAGRTRLLNGPEVFAWNVDKAYLTGLGVRVGRGADPHGCHARGAGRRRPRVRRRRGQATRRRRWRGRPGRGRPGRSPARHRGEGPPRAPAGRGPWVVQPLVASVRTEGETSVFVLGGVAVSQVDKLPTGGEIRVHEHFGGVSRPVPLRDEAAELAVAATVAADRVLGLPLDYGRVDMMRLADGTLAVSELEVTEPGLYLDVLPENGDAFAGLVATLVR